MTDTKHTPTPWRVGEQPVRGYEAMIRTDDGYAIADLPGGLAEGDPAANAALIARAVNNHERLVDALEKCSTWMAEHGCVPPCLSEALAALAALAAAREGE